MAVLYRKFRPQTFAQVVGQKPIIKTLTNQVKSGSVAHAYLFTGSRGVGKTSVARILAKAVNCKRANQRISESANQLGDACGECDVCKAIEAGNFIDLVEVDAASNTGVDNIRDLIEHVRFSPSLGKYKVFIIDEVHMLSKGAFNALLKTLEEPPKHAIFILATTEINKVPATIVSRTQRFDFKALTSADLEKHLQYVAKEEKLKFSDEVLQLIAQNAEGSGRDALSLLDKISTLGNEASLEDARQLLGITDIALCESLVNLIAQGQAGEIPEFFSSLGEKGLDYAIFNRDFLEFLRKILVFKVTDGGIKFDERVGKLAERFSINDIIFLIRLFLKSYKDLGSSPDPEIPLLLAALEAALRKSSDVGQQAVVSKQASPKLASQNIESVKKPELAVEVEHLAINETNNPLSLSEVTEVWPKVIDKIKAINSPLASMLRGSELIGVEDGKVILGVRFLFDKQNLENMKNAGLISQTFLAVTGKHIGILGRVTKETKTESGNTVEVLSQALQVFGGELVD